jgi:hypothetical protein
LDIFINVKLKISVIYFRIMNVIKIGSCIARFTTGTTLANAGYKVNIIMANYKPGSVTSGHKYSHFCLELGYLPLEGLREEERHG